MKRRQGRSAAHIETLEPRWLLTHFGDFFNAKTPSNITIANGAVLYLNDDGIHGTEIWRSDGTQAGTALVKDIRPGAEPMRSPDVDYFWRYFLPNPPLYTWNGSTYFAADDGVHGSRLWKSDGTAAGTALVTGTNPTSDPFEPGEFIAFNGGLYFNALGATGEQLWRTDGTPTGTTLIAASFNNEITQPTVLGNTLYFLTRSSSGNFNNLWRSDGTTQGTSLVPVTLPTSPRMKNITLIVSGGQLLVITSGSDASTVSRLNANGASLIPVYQSVGRVTVIRTVGGKLGFVENAYGFLNLFVSDGTAAGTKAVWEGTLDNALSYGTPEDGFHAAANGFFFEVHATHDAPLELWFTDGTAASTRRLSTGSFTTDLHLANFVSVGGDTYFTDAGKIWKSNGTAAGTLPVADLPFASTFDQSARDLTPLNGRLFFIGIDDIRDADLWAYRIADRTMTHLRSVLPSFSLRRGILSIGGTSYDDDIRINVSPAAGTFTIYWDKAPSRSYNLVDTAGGILVHTEAGDDSILISGNLPRLTLAGGNGNDTITGSAGDELIQGDYGDDMIMGLGGNDTLVGDDGTETSSSYSYDTLDGGDGDDSLFGGSSPDVLYGGAGNDTLHGGLHDDHLFGGAGDDQLFGDDGDDTLDGDNGPDGADTFSGGPGIDTADYSQRLEDLTISLDGRRHDGGLGERDNILDDIERIYAGAGNDLLVGSTHADLLVGNDGNDTVYGGAGNDTLDGGLGVDILDGGRGNDEFYSGSDNGAHDFLYGGKGIDRAQTDRRDSRDSIETLFK
ncbi:MAG: hypothetical protein JWN40_5469 [Phycisphaerales bacterium]|nr:hypothetical protein [Phycisphaerales bacterium]